MGQTLDEAVEHYAQAFHSVEDLTPILEAVGEAKIVLLGEATHGTSEFYTLRADLTKRLIQEKGFSLIAVEGDWPSAQHVNSYIRKSDPQGKSRDVLQAFRRWPTWMWANEEIAAFVEWLKADNEHKELKTGFYGIDVYSLWESMEEVIHYLTHTNPTGGDLELAKKAFSCFEPFNRNPENYAISSANFSTVCVNEVSQLLASIRSNPEAAKGEAESELSLEVNALVARNAEDYYRAMVQSGELSWNIRDQHMVEAIQTIRNYHGAEAKIVVWEHNTHIGDARATDMRRDGMLNVGQLLREQHGPDEVFALGFGTYEGTVIAADAWGIPHDVIEVPPARLHSWEEILHRTGAFDKFLIFTDENRKLFDRWVGHRAIGVVYNPEFEAHGNYVPSQISKRYDAFIFIDRTKALRPIPIEDLLIE